MNATADAMVAPETPGLSEADISRIAEGVMRMMQSGKVEDNTTTELIESAKPGDIYRNGPANIAQGDDISGDTIAIVQNARNADIQRGITTATGFIGYDLKTPAAMLVPFLTPLLNMLPRENGLGIDIHNWKAVTTSSVALAHSPSSVQSPTVAHNRKSPIA